VTFFRTLGSSFGAAVFGTIYSNVLSHRLPAAIAASPGVDPRVVSTPAELHQYPKAKIARSSTLTRTRSTWYSSRRSQ